MNVKAGHAADRRQDPEPGPSASVETYLTEAEKERIRSEEIRLAQERKYRDEVRKQLRSERRSSEFRGSIGQRALDVLKLELWPRVLAMLKFKPGIVQEIASDPNSTKQGAIVLVAAQATSSIFSFLLIPIAVPAAFVVIAAAAGLLCLTSRLFSKQVPAYQEWLRALMFATAPRAIGLVPILGDVAGNIYTLVLMVFVTRNLARVSTEVAAVIVLLPLLSLGAITAVSMLSFGAIPFLISALLAFLAL